MNLFDYIKSQLPSMPNVAIMKDMGASDGLIEYIRHTTWNTNLGMLSAYGCEPEGGGGEDAEVWLVGNTGVEQSGMMTFALSNVDATDHITELFTNAENYSVYLNGVEMPYYSEQDLGYGAGQKLFADAEEQSSITKFVQIVRDGGGKITAFAGYMDTSTAPTSVEVSVKAK